MEFDTERMSQRSLAHAASSLPRWLARNGLMAAAYYVAARISLIFIFQDIKVTAVWLPSGIALAAMLAYGPRILPGVFIGDFLAGIEFGSSVMVALWVAVAGSLEAYLGWRMILAMKSLESRGPLIGGTVPIVRFVVFGAILAPILPAVLGALALRSGGVVGTPDLVRTAAVWWTGDLVGALVVLPPALLALTWGKQPIIRSRWDIPLLLATVMLCAFVFSRPPQQYDGAQTMIFLMFPMLVLCAFSLSVMLLAIANVLVTATALIGTKAGLGPYAHYGSVVDIWYLQAFVSALVVTSCLVRGAIADRRRAERHSMETEGHFHAAADHGALLLIILRKVRDESHDETRWIVSYANRRARTHIVHASAMLQNVDLWRAIPDLDKPALRERIEQTLASMTSYEQDLTLSDEAGQAHWFRMNCIPLSEAMMLTLLDITPQKQAENALREREEQFRAIVSLSPDAITIHQDGRWVFANPAAARLLGVNEPSDLVGRSLLDFMHPEVHDRVKERWRELYVERRKVTPSEICMIRPDGSQIYLETHAAPIDWKGAPAAEVIARDSTERRASERALRDYASRLSTLSRRLMDVEENERRNISRELHDRIGQNLSVTGLALAAVRMELEREGSQRMRAKVEGIERRVQETNAHVRNVMAELHPPALEEYGLLAALRALASTYAFNGTPRVSVEGTEPDPRLPRSTEMAMFRIAQESVVNAVKHAHAGQIAIHLKCEGESVTMTISDNGTGVDSSGIDRNGISWGMTIMRERAEAIGALLKVESGQDMGTCVVVRMAGEAR